MNFPRRALIWSLSESSPRPPWYFGLVMVKYSTRCLVESCSRKFSWQVHLTQPAFACLSVSHVLHGADLFEGYVCLAQGAFVCLLISPMYSVYDLRRLLHVILWKDAWNCCRSLTRIPKFMGLIFQNWILPFPNSKFSKLLICHWFQFLYRSVSTFTKEPWHFSQIS